LDRRTNTSDGAGGASPTVVTAPHDDDDDLMADTGKDTKIMTASATRSARAKVARAAAAAKEVLANGSSGMDEKTAVTQEVPALPADSIGTPRDSASLSRPVAAPVAPDADDDPADLRDQEGGGNLIGGQVQPATPLLEHLQLSAPFHPRLKPEAEDVTLRRHNLKSAPVRRLIVVAKRPKPQRLAGVAGHRDRLVGRMWRRQRIWTGRVDPSGGHGP